MYRRIRDLREDHDYLQKDLAEYLHCSQVCYSHYEIGKRDIPTEVLLRLAVFYDTSVDYLLGRTDVVVPYPCGKEEPEPVKPTEVRRRRRGCRDSEIKK